MQSDIATLGAELFTNFDYAASDADDRRTWRARTQSMLVLPETDTEGDATGLYHVFSQSGSNYLADPELDSCTCPDMAHNDPENGCKHIRRVSLAIDETSLPARTESTDDYWTEFDATTTNIAEQIENLNERIQQLGTLLDAGLVAKAELADE
ncbi:hypothetical protein [Halomarina oriensis]|uniref:SWIM-type domain-containing protein n=1 Tax=Halomarina oriensis TaxID=671145 RepID=A0A6B0GF43_9EURY|nr:hypothetical protein [Halomarina oriensis]MWG33120.1 hypothetical protein [Halomarina oriensis]